MGALLQQLEHEYALRAIAELILLAAISGAIGPWILLRGLSFFAHAIGSAAFPGLIVADAIGLLPQVGAAAGAATVAAGAGVLSQARGNGARTALWLTGALAAGALIASDLSEAGAGVDAALFGSLLTSDWFDVATAAGALAAAVAVTWLGEPRWIAEELVARPAGAWTAALLAAVGIAVIAQLPAVGALLASSLLMLATAAAQPWIHSLRGWQVTTFVFAAAIGLGGLLASLSLDTPPGGTIALLAGCAAVASAAARRVRSRIGAVRAAAALAASIGIAGCATDTKPDVATGTPIVGSIASEVAGGDLKVRSLVPAGADPHTWEPRPSDVESLASARLLLLNGGGLDSWAKRLRNRSGSGAAVVELYSFVPDRRTNPANGKPDPHWFHDPAAVAAAAREISRRFALLAPGKAAAFRARADQLASEAAALGAQARTCVRRLTPRQRLLVTDHDAFRYFSAALGLRIEGSLLSSQSSAGYPSPVNLANLVEAIRADRIKAVFPERSLDSKLVRAISAATGARADVQLDADTLGPASTRATTWASMWSGNVSRLVAALSGGAVICKLLTNGVDAP